MYTIPTYNIVISLFLIIINFINLTNIRYSKIIIEK